MKRILFIISALLCNLTVNAQVNCYQGDQNPPDQNDHTQHPLDDTTTSGGISATQTKSLVLRAMIPSVGSALTMC